MKYLWIFPYYLGWHYGRGTVETIIVFRDFLLFIPKFFSIGTLLKTLFSPFQRLTEKYNGGLDLANLAEVVVINLLMRIIGFIVRTFFIIIGLIAFIFTFVLEIVLFVIWMAMPFIIVFTFITALIGLIKLRI